MKNTFFKMNKTDKDSIGNNEKADAPKRREDNPANLYTINCDNTKYYERNFFFIFRLQKLTNVKKKRIIIIIGSGTITLTVRSSQRFTSALLSCSIQWNQSPFGFNGLAKTAYKPGLSQFEIINCGKMIKCL